MGLGTSRTASHARHVEDATGTALLCLALLAASVLMHLSTASVDRTGGSGQHMAHSKYHVSTPQSLGDLHDMLVSIGLEEHFSKLQNAGLTNLEAVASHEGACPEGIKAFHCRRMKHASYELLLPDSEKEPEVQGDAANELPEATPEQLKLTICTSWAATKGLFAFMKEHKNGQSPAPTVRVPLCERAQVPERGVLYGVDQNTEATAVTQVVGQKGAWVPNELTVGQVGMLRRRGVLDQLVVDRERRIMYCGVPKAGMTFFKSWFLKRHGLWDVLNRKRAELGFGGPRNGGVEKLVDGRHMRDEEIREVLNDGGYFKYTFVRDPLARVLAVFNERFAECAKQASPTECRQWMRALTGFSARRGKAETLTLREMLRILEKQQGAADVTYQTAHWLPQTTVCAMEHIAYDFVGRIEGQNGDTQVLYDAAEFQSLTFEQRKQLDASLDVRHLLHYYGEDSAAVRASVEAVNRIYKRDMDLLGYTGQSLFEQLLREQ